MINIVHWRQCRWLALSSANNVGGQIYLRAIHRSLRLIAGNRIPSLLGIPSQKPRGSVRYFKPDQEIWHPDPRGARKIGRCPCCRGNTIEGKLSRVWADEITAYVNFLKSASFSPYRKSIIGISSIVYAPGACLRLALALATRICPVKAGLLIRISNLNS